MYCLSARQILSCMHLIISLPVWTGKQQFVQLIGRNCLWSMEFQDLWRFYWLGVVASGRSCIESYHALWCAHMQKLNTGLDESLRVLRRPAVRGRPDSALFVLELERLTGGRCWGLKSWCLFTSRPKHHQQSQGMCEWWIRLTHYQSRANFKYNWVDISLLLVPKFAACFIHYLIFHFLHQELHHSSPFASDTQPFDRLTWGF